MRMPSGIEKAFADANWKELAPRLQKYTHHWLGRKKWIGYGVIFFEGKPCFDGKTPDDFISDAVESFCRRDASEELRAKLIGQKMGRRYNEAMTLEVNLQGAIRSEIWNTYRKLHPGLVKKRQGQGQEEICESEELGAKEPVVTVTADAEYEPDFIPEEDWEPGPIEGEKPPHEPEVAETRARQKALLEEFRETIAGDDELGYLLVALEEGETRPREIAKTTGIPAPRVSELKRKLQGHFEAFLKERPQDDDLFE